MIARLAAAVGDAALLWLLLVPIAWAGNVRWLLTPPGRREGDRPPYQWWPGDPR